MISVIIPCYNGEDVINEAVQSCFNQGIDKQDLEIIVVDDNSEVNISDIIPDHPSIRCIRNSSNLGPSGSRNIGIQLAKGEFVAFLDADDLMINNRLITQLHYLHEHKSDFVISAIEELSVSGTRKEIIFDLSLQKKKLVKDIFLDKIYSITPTIFFRKSILKETGLMDESLRHFEDKDFLLKVVKKYQIGYIKKPLLLRRVFESGTSRSVDEETFLKSRKLFIEKAILRFQFLKKYRSRFWAKQYRGLGRLFLEKQEKSKALQYSIKSLSCYPTLKAMALLLGVLIPARIIVSLKK